MNNTQPIKSKNYTYVLTLCLFFSIIILGVGIAIYDINAKMNDSYPEKVKDIATLFSNDTTPNQNQQSVQGSQTKQPKQNTPEIKPSDSPSPSPTPTPTTSPSESPTAQPTKTPTPSPSPSPTHSYTPEPTNIPSPTPTPSPTQTPSPTPTPTMSPSPTPTLEPE